MIFLLFYLLPINIAIFAIITSYEHLMLIVYCFHKWILPKPDGIKKAALVNCLFLTYY